MNLSRLLPLSCVLVLMGSLAPSGVARAASPLQVLNPSRSLECYTGAVNSTESDDGSDVESSTDPGEFLRTVFAAATISDAQAEGGAFQSSNIDSSGVQLQSTLDVSASAAGLSSSSSAMASNDLSVSFYHAGAVELPYSFRVTLEGSPGVQGGASFGGGGTTHTVNFGVDSGSYEFSGNLLPGRTYTLVASAGAMVEADRFSGSTTEAESANFSVVFELEEATSAPGWGASATRLEVWPNPFRGRAQVSLRGPAPGGTLRVLDLRGRELRSVVLAPERRGWSWDGRDARGQAAPAGVYFLHWDGAGERDAERVVLLR